jgi:hypothetical protein
MNNAGATWIGGGAIAAITVPLVASLCVALTRASGIPVGDLREFPVAMILLWGPILGAILAGPVAFVLGAWAVRRVQRTLAAPQRSKTIVWRCSSFVAVGGALWGGVLAKAGIAGMHVGWALIPVGLVAGAVGGGLVALVVLSDLPGPAHAA